MPSRRRILFLSQCLPYPPHTGVTNRTFNVLRQLQREFDVVLLPFFRINHQPTPQARRAACQALAQVVTEVCTPVPIASEGSRARRLWNHLRALVARRPFTYYEYGDDRYRDGLRSALERWKPDLVHLDSLDLYRWLPELPPLPLTCTHHNIESQLLRTRAAQTRPRLLARYVRSQAELIERLERERCARFRLNVMMSDLDAERLKQLVPDARTVVVPNGVDTEFFQPRGVPVVPGRVVFLGPLHMFPNRDGLKYFIQDVWPVVQLGCGGAATLQVVGACSDAQRKQFGKVPGVVCVGYVEDIRPYLAGASCCVVPLRVGGGTRLKVLDAWAMGKAVVSTSLGCEGLDTFDGHNILVRDDPQAFAAAVLDLLADTGMRERLESGARQKATERYSWDRVGGTLRGAYREILGLAASATPPRVALDRSSALGMEILERGS